MNIKKVYFPILAIFVSFHIISCSDKRSRQISVQKQDTVTANAPKTITTYPDLVLLDSISAVKGYETHKYIISAGTDGKYSFIVSSDNTGIIFVIQDAEGNNVINETSSEWSGELKRGSYTLIVGLTRNAARKNMNKEVKFSVVVKQVSHK